MRYGRGRDHSHDGLHITGSGNQVNTGRVSGGMRNTYLGSGADDPRLSAAQARLADLTAALQAHATEVHSLDNCQVALSRINEELHSPSPNRQRITETLQMLGLAIGSVAAVATSAENLKTAIEALLT